MKRVLSKSQERVYNAYVLRINTKGRCPTYTQVAKELKLRPSWVHKHVLNLEKLHLLKRDTEGKIQIVPKEISYESVMQDYLWLSFDKFFEKYF